MEPAGWMGVVLCVAGAAGCSTHVNLRVPSRTAPSGLRCKAYAELRPTHASQTVYSSGNGRTIVDQRTLANGIVVTELDDLRQIVDPSSPTSQSLNAAVHHERRTFWYRVGGSLSLLASLGFLVATVADSGHDLYAIPTGAALAGTGYSLYSVYTHDEMHKKARRTAMISFDLSLRNRLDLSEEAITRECVGSEPW